MSFRRLLTQQFVVMYIDWYILHPEQDYLCSFGLTNEAWNDLQTDRNNFYSSPIYTCNESAIFDFEIFAADQPRFKECDLDFTSQNLRNFKFRGFLVCWRIFQTCCKFVYLFNPIRIVTKTWNLKKS